MAGKNNTQAPADIPELTLTLTSLQADMDARMGAIAKLFAQASKRMDQLETAFAGMAVDMGVGKALVDTPAPVSAKQAPAAKGKAATKAKPTKEQSEHARIRDANKLAGRAMLTAQYVCSCGGYAWKESFKAEHEAKGHTITGV